jgi:uncharacterized protein YdaT
MPWTVEHYPASMKDLPSVVRTKAIIIANALLEEGYGEDHCIRIAIDRAKTWGEARGLMLKGGNRIKSFLDGD